MLETCKECLLPVSDKAVICPHCGYPRTNKVVPIRKSSKRKRLPNGFGRITELKNPNLRNRYRVMVTTGKDSDGRPVGTLLKPKAYFKTYNDAYAALIEYNKDPYNIEKDLTCNEVYEIWLEQYKKRVTSYRSVTSAWRYCTDLYNVPITAIRTRHIKETLESIESTSLRHRAKSVLNMVLDYAVEYELIEKNYSREIFIKEFKDENKQPSHMSYTEVEMAILWSNVHQSTYVRMILVQCYSGWRPKELCELKLENINLEERTMTGGCKTTSGKNRIVPIHDCIFKIIEEEYHKSKSMNCVTLFRYDKPTDQVLTYDKYQKRFYRVRDDLGLNKQHKPHDGRKHFITMCKKYDVDEYAIKRMVGHRIADLTEAVYTERPIEWLKSEMAKIKNPSF